MTKTAKTYSHNPSDFASIRDKAVMKQAKGKPQPVTSDQPLYSPKQERKTDNKPQRSGDDHAKAVAKHGRIYS